MVPHIKLSIQGISITVNGSNNRAASLFVPSEELGPYVYINEQEPSRIPKTFTITKNSLLRKILAKDIVY